MTEPDWLIKEALLDAYEYLISETEGSYGIRDEALLESGLSRPQNLYAYEDADIFDLAAAYAEGISSNHPFIDGNKRAAFLAAAGFLRQNGFDLEVEKENEQAQLFLKLADGKVSREELAEWYRQHTQPLEQERDKEVERQTRAAEKEREEREHQAKERKAEDRAERIRKLFEEDERRKAEREEAEKAKGKTRSKDF